MTEQQPDDAPTCAHCGQALRSPSRVFTTFGGATRDDYLWHMDRGPCLDAAQAHIESMQKAGRAVPPAAETDPGSST